MAKKRMCMMIFWGTCLVFLAACKRDTALEIQRITDIPLPPDAKEIDLESTDLRLHRALSYEMLYALGALWNVSAEGTDEDFFELPLGLSIKDDVRKYYGDILPDRGWQKQDTSSIQSLTPIDHWKRSSRKGEQNLVIYYLLPLDTSKLMLVRFIYPIFE